MNPLPPQSSDAAPFQPLAEYDPCPVCGKRVPLAKRTPYCSPDCNRRAYNFRKRVSDVVHFLSNLGFQTRWLSGTMLEIRLRKWSQFYPTSCDPIIFPLDYPYYVAIDDVNSETLWDLLAEYLGHSATHFIRWLYDRDGNSPIYVEQNNALLQVFYTAILDSDNYYHSQIACKCDDCHRMLVASPHRLHHPIVICGGCDAVGGLF